MANEQIRPGQVWRGPYGEHTTVRVVRVDRAAADERETIWECSVIEPESVRGAITWIFAASLRRGELLGSPLQAHIEPSASTPNGDRPNPLGIKDMTEDELVTTIGDTLATFVLRMRAAFGHVAFVSAWKKLEANKLAGCASVYDAVRAVSGFPAECPVATGQVRVSEELGVLIVQKRIAADQRRADDVWEVIVLDEDSRRWNKIATESDISSMRLVATGAEVL